MSLAVVMERLWRFNRIIDSRFEDLERDSWAKTLYRDFSAGLIVALTAIPMAMGFALASGLRPEQGIIAGALACLIGRTWGGSKYQVYGPTAAFIPVIAAIMSKYGAAAGYSFEVAHGFLALCSLVAGLVLIVMGLLGMGKYAKLVPNSIVVGFTVGIAIVIALSNLGGALGITAELKGNIIQKLRALWLHLGEANGYSILLAAGTFFSVRYLLKISIFIPAPLIALGASSVLASTFFAGKGIAVIGQIPTNFFQFTPPVLPAFTPSVLIDLVYFASAIVFVSGVESLLCSSMADRLARNTKTPFDPDKEFWGQGLVQVITPMINGFPCTGALARTATSIKAGAVTPFAGFFKCFLKLGLAFYLAPWLAHVPMACIGGILLWVASNMVKPDEIREVMKQGRFQTGMMFYTAAMVPLTDFLTGVLSAMIIYFVLHRFFGHEEVLQTTEADGAL
jgi:SulP family sulfate permease